MRSRLALLTVNDQLQLVHEKSNLGPLQDPILLTWDGPVLIPQARNRVAEKLSDERRLTDDATSVFDAMNAAINAGDTVNATKSGNATVWHALASYSELDGELRAKSGKQRVFNAVVHLMQTNRIHQEEYRGNNRHMKKNWYWRKPMARQSPNS